MGRGASEHAQQEMPSGHRRSALAIDIRERRNEDGDQLFTASLAEQEVGWLVLRPMANLETGAEPGDDDYDENAKMAYLVGNITVKEEFRRQGIATALWRSARAKHEVEHDWDQLSADAEEWLLRLDGS